MGCLNCEKENVPLRKKHCTKCYSLILRIEKIEKGILPEILEHIKTDFNFFDAAKKEYIRQIKYRLELIKESNLLSEVSAHDLEYRINGTLRVLDGKTLGKINDSLAHYLKDDRTRAYVYQLFTKIQLLKPFKIDYYQVYRTGRD